MEAEAAWLILMGIALLAGILSGVPVMFAIAGVPLLVALLAAATGHFDLAFVKAFPQRVFGVMNNTLLIAVPMFVLMGVLLESSRIAERMLVSVARLMGGAPSMMALSVLLVSALIAASTGIIGATIVMLTLIALPSLLSSGVSKHTSAGLVCAAGTLGQIIPPSIVLILLGDQISNAHIEAQREIGNFAPDPVSVGDLFAGALLPGLLLVGLYGLYVVLVVGRPAARARSASGHVGEHPAAGPDRLAQQLAELDLPENPTAATLLAQILPPAVLIILVLGSILMGVATPTEAAVVGVAGTVMLTAAYMPQRRRFLRPLILIAGASAFLLVVMKTAGLTRMGWGETFAVTPVVIVTFVLTGVITAALICAIAVLLRQGVLVGAMSQTVRVSAMVFGIVLASSMLSLIFRGFGGDDLVHDLLTSLPGGQWTMLAITMLAIFALGFILEFVEIVFIVIPIVGPVLLQFEIDPVWFAILIALNLQTSFLTPPFGFALFYFRSVAPREISTGDIYVSIIPFVAIQLIAIAIVAAFPALATWLPKLLFG